MLSLLVTIRGTKPLMTHHSRLSNPMDVWARQLKQLPKKKATEQQLLDIIAAEVRGGCWETGDDIPLFAVNNSALWKSVVVAARMEKKGKEVERALIIDEGYTALQLDGKSLPSESIIKRGFYDYRPVVVQSSRVMRARPKIPSGWTCAVPVLLDESQLNPQDFGTFLERAGRYCGLGEMRPRLGTFEIVNIVPLDDTSAKPSRRKKAA